MFRKTIGVALAATILLLLGAFSASAAQETGTIKGTVTNGTAGGAALSDSEVSLTAYKGTTESGTQTAKLNPEGQFAFEGLDTAPDITYQASFDHQGAIYYSEPLTFSVDTLEHSIEMKVFDATTDPAVVTSSARHFLLQPTDGGVRVSEIMILANGTDKTFVGSEEAHPGMKTTLSFTVPTEAVDLELGDGFIPTHAFPVDGGFVDTWPVFPGGAQRIYSYTIPSSAGSASFTSKIALATEKVNVLMPDVGAEVSVSNLPDRSNPDIQGNKYVHLAGTSLAAGTELAFQLDRLPAATSGAPAQGGAPASAGDATGGMIAYIAGSGVIVIMAIALGVITIRRRRQASRVPEAAAENGEEDEEDGSETEEEDELEGERQDLVAAIASLDDAYEQGRIGSEEYGMLRADQKARLLEIVAKQNELAANRGD